MVILLGDLFSLVPALIHTSLLYLILNNHRYSFQSIFYWAIFYLISFNGVITTGKTLVILGGNAWEINMLRYGIDLALVFIGTMIFFLRKKMIVLE